MAEVAGVEAEPVTPLHRRQSPPHPPVAYLDRQHGWGSCPDHSKNQ